MDKTPFYPPVTKCFVVALQVHKGLPVIVDPAAFFVRKSQILTLLSKEQLNTILLSVGWALTQDTPYLWPYKIPDTFSLAISIIFKLSSSLAVIILFESSVKFKDLIIRWCGFNWASLFFLSNFTINKSPLSFPVAKNLSSFDTVRDVNCT